MSSKDKKGDTRGDVPAREWVTKRFPLGHDPEAYVDAAIEAMKERYGYHWASREYFSKQYRYAIERKNPEKDDSGYRYVKYTIYSKKDIERQVMKKSTSADEFIQEIVSDQTYSLLGNNRVVETYEVGFEPMEINGWFLERYEFNRRETGDFCAFVQAGDRYTGGSRDFYIPCELFELPYDEFMDRYQEIVPAEAFGLTKEHLMADAGLKEFLGFGDKRDGKQG